jgi:hypothetical protein
MGKLMRINGDAVPSKIVIARWEAGKHAPQIRYVTRLDELTAMSSEQIEKLIEKKGKNATA